MSNTDGTSGNSSSERNHDIPDPKGRFQAMRHSGILTDLTEIVPLSVSRGTLCDWCDHCLNRSRPIFWNMSRRCGEVENSAAQCQLCFILKELIKNADALYKGTVEGADASLHNRFRSPPMGKGVPSGCLNVEFYISNPSKGTSCEIGNLMFIPAENQLAINVETIPATVTEQTWELIQTWMEICNTDHPHCCVDSETQDHRNPSRLLEIDPPGLNSKIRLIEGVEIPPKARYMTLSHCWGSGQPVVLNSDTWEQFRDSFAISDLPKTFQDAVKITKRLHVKYLWIDSLCIIQGSQEDWAKESGRMASVYGGSYCNIAASGASDCNGGCLGPRAQISQYRPVRVVRNTVETPSSRYLDNHFDFVCVQVGPEWRELGQCPLACRAWVFQERALAPRTLHFGLSQLYWECSQHLVCERYPESPGAIVNLMSRSYKLLNKLLQQPTDLIWWRYPELKRAWVDFMSDYSASRLTYDTDRLVAMAGIVDRFAEGLQDDFLGGLWRKRLFS